MTQYLMKVHFKVVVRRPKTLGRLASVHFLLLRDCDQSPDSVVLITQAQYRQDFSEPGSYTPPSQPGDGETHTEKCPAVLVQMRAPLFIDTENARLMIPYS